MATPFVRSPVRRVAAPLGILGLVALHGCGAPTTCEAVGTRGVACPDGSTLNADPTAPSALVRIQEEPPGSHCAHGGQRIDTGLDRDGSGALDDARGETPTEVETTTYVCNGAPGDAGADTILAVDPVPAGEDCPYGGVQIRSGVDHDGDRVLSTSEIDATELVCDGAPGDAATTVLTSLAPGDPTCAAGGVRVETGVDRDRDGTLDAEELATSETLCHGTAGTDGAQSLLATSPVLAGEAGCEAGGVKIQAGVDDDRDGLLSFDEIDHTHVVCHGPRGADGTPGATGADGKDGLSSLLSVQALSPGDPTCATGGVRLSTGRDLDRDGYLDVGEITSMQVVCDGVDGSDGATTLVRTEPVDPGDTLCAAGGLRISSGPDLDRNDVLDAIEIEASQTLCHGLDGADGAPGAQALVRETRDATATATCPAGTLTLAFGVDDGDGDGQLAANGVLDAVEVDSSVSFCLPPFEATTATVSTFPAGASASAFDFVGLDGRNGGFFHGGAYYQAFRGHGGSWLAKLTLPSGALDATFGDAGWLNTATAAQARSEMVSRPTFWETCADEVYGVTPVDGGFHVDRFDLDTATWSPVGTGTYRGTLDNVECVVDTLFISTQDNASPAIVQVFAVDTATHTLTAGPIESDSNEYRSVLRTTSGQWVALGAQAFKALDPDTYAATSTTPFVWDRDYLERTLQQGPDAAIGFTRSGTEVQVFRGTPDAIIAAHTDRDTPYTPTISYQPAIAAELGASWLSGVQLCQAGDGTLGFAYAGVSPFDYGDWGFSLYAFHAEGVALPAFHGGDDLVLTGTPYDHYTGRWSLSVSCDEASGLGAIAYRANDGALTVDLVNLGK